ncbi:MAG: hypothetical protein IPI49_22260 [Myxococcales bacterium]|nr:hypothetical protein [Myxococcales bacterium]HRC59306.1 hypothetical protein [Kofleriaceae bacterium]
MRRSLVAVILVVAVAGAVGLLRPTPAHADTTPTSTLAQLMLLEPGDSSYRLFHGAVWLGLDKASTNYRWGGLQCKGRELSETSIQILYAAYRNGDQVTLEYVASEYNQKQFRCLTGFTIAKP